LGRSRGPFRHNGVDYLNIGALARAPDRRRCERLSTPNILTTDNQKAEIMVGQNVPFTVGQTQNATTGVSSVFQQIERKDVGIKLAITPQISSDDNVRLDINQEISDVVAASATNATGFITNKRSATTTVVVKDRETMVIGGLIRDNVTRATGPLLGDIPVLGWLFAHKTTRVEKTNLMIFITPYFIKNEQDAGISPVAPDVMESRKEHHIEKKKDMEPLPSQKSADQSTVPAPLTPSAVTNGTDAMQNSPTVTAPAAEAVETGPTVTIPAPEQSTTPEWDQR
jgi:type II secretory pathway component GspD/PulD (secretin)